jgi:steroid delta-isomerase-like uncharacterized protein
MTSDEIRAFIEAYRDAWVRRDVPALVADYADDCELVSPMFRTVHGRSGVETSFRELFKGFSEWTIELDELLIDHEDGDRCAVFWKANAVQAGEMFGFPASGRRFQISVVHFYRFANARIVTERRLYDFSSLLMQLGILKAKAGG